MHIAGMDIELRHLTASQRRAATCTDLPALLTGVIGSGKTTTLAARLKWQASNLGVKERIIGVIPDERCHRQIRDMLGASAPRVELYSLTQFYRAVLQEWRDEVNVSGSVRTLAEPERVQLVEALLRHHGLSLRRFSGALVLSILDEARRRGWSSDVLRQRAREPAIDVAATIFDDFVQLLLVGNVLDRPQLAYEVYQWVRDARVASDADRTFGQVQVDYIEDLSIIDVENLIALSNRQLWMTGDSAQSYGRTAATEATHTISHIKQEFEVTHFHLQTSFTTSKELLDASQQGLVSALGYEKFNSQASSSRFKELQVAGVADETQEADRIARWLFERKGKDDEAHFDVIICSTGPEQGARLARELRNKGVETDPRGTTSVFSATEEPMALVYLLLNPDDPVAALTVLNAIQGVGPKTKRRLLARSLENEKSLVSTLREAKQAGIHTKARNAIKDFVSKLDTWRARQLAERAVQEALRLLRKEVAPAKGPISSITVQHFERKEAWRSIEEALHELKPEGTPFTLSCLRSHLYNAEQYCGRTDTIPLIPLQHLKGHFPKILILSGVEEGLIPRIAKRGEKQRLQSDRRLFLHCISRGREAILITHADARVYAGNLRRSQPSRFLDEIPEVLLDREEETHSQQGKTTLLNSHRRTLAEIAREEQVGVADLFRKRNVTFEGGDRIRHEHLGEGTVVTIEMDGEEAILVVEFDQVGRKKMMLRHAPISPT